MADSLPYPMGCIWTYESRSVCTLSAMLSGSREKYPTLSNWNLSKTFAPRTEMSTKALSITCREFYDTDRGGALRKHSSTGAS